MENGKEAAAKQGLKISQKQQQQQQLGGIRTMPFILANEVCDRFAMAGYQANMISYLTQILNLPLVKASNILTNFNGTANFTPLIGAFLADSFAGRFWIIILGTIFYLLGMGTLTTTASIHKLQPPACPTQVDCREASSKQVWLLYLALLLTAMGTGGIRPCLVTFAADQFDLNKLKKKARACNFFNWYYFCMGAASVLAATVVVYIQDNVGWSWGFGIPTIAMGLSLMAFVVGSSLYKKVKPRGSPFVRAMQVLVAALRKRKFVAPEDPKGLYSNHELDAGISTDGQLLHSAQFKWLDRAAVALESDMKGLDNDKPNLWRLATIHRVEELKTVIRLVPIWSTTLLFVASHAHVHSFTVQQARTMDRHLSQSFQIPPASMVIFIQLTVLIGVPLYETIFVPLARRATGNPAGITSLQRMGIGFFINIFSTIVSAKIEVKRKSVAAAHSLLDRPATTVPISVFWLVPQHCMHGLAEVFMYVGHLEFLYDQAPESMRSTAAAMFWISTGIGNYMSTGIVTLVHQWTNWLPDRNLNQGKLENYYWLVTIVQVINLMYYVVCAWLYKYKPLKEVREKGDDIEIEMGKK